MLASYNNPAASAVDTHSAMDNVFAAVGFPWAPAVVIVAAVAGVPTAVVVLTAIDVLGVPAVAALSYVAAVPIAVEVFSL